MRNLFEGMEQPGLFWSVMGIFGLIILALLITLIVQYPLELAAMVAFFILAVGFGQLLRRLVGAP